jgi:hypothetical protein
MKRKNIIRIKWILAILFAPVGILLISRWIGALNANRNNVFTKNELSLLKSYVKILYICGIISIMYGIFLYLI